MSSLSSKIIQMMKKTACITYEVADSAIFYKALRSGKFKADIPGAKVTGVEFENIEVLRKYISYLWNSITSLGAQGRCLDYANWVEQNMPKDIRDHRHPNDLTLLTPIKEFSEREEEEDDDEEEEEEEEEAAEDDEDEWRLVD